MSLSTRARLVVPAVVTVGAALLTAGAAVPADDRVAQDGAARSGATASTTAQPARPAGSRYRQSRLLVGEWRMDRLQLGLPGEREEVDFSGRIFFTEGGTVAVQARNPDEDAPATPFSWDGYESYYGSYASNARTARVAFVVRSSLVRELEGERLVRNYRVSRDTLVLTPADPEDGFRVTYRRVR